ncbi:LuxR family transcriptional regulator [Phytohabitans houttuyneae]|uniref:ATP-binding protein n=1 Tax=Phytohabitans houttuyneae TaxID=1076126 RepID=UPI0031E9249B
MRRGSSLLIGRESELRGVTESLTSARAGRGGAVFLVGEGGIGKSRLAEAVAQQAFAAEMTLMRGRSSAIGTVVPLRPLTEALLSLLRSNPVDVGTLGPYGPILGRLIPDWGGQPAEHEGSSSLVILAEAVLRLTGLSGGRRGCLMTLEDLQDADAETLMVVEYLIDNLDLQPTLLLGTIRDESCAALTLARSAARRGRCLVIDLDRLDRDDTRRMAGACLGGEPDDVPAAAADLLFAGSAGNPFLIEELLAGMVDSGVLVSGAEGWQMAERLPANPPTSFARGIAHGVEQLSPPARKLLSVAALLGRRFPLAVVQAATAMSDRDLLNHLQGEFSGRLVTPDDQLTDWYAFRHQLTRETLLSLLPQEERTGLAHTVVAAVERTYPGLPGEWCQFAATLYLEAGDAPAAGRLLTEAGRRALAQGAANSAVTLLDKAWSLPADETGRATTLETLLYALAEAGLVERALGSVGLLDQVGALDVRRRANLHTRLAWAAAVAGRSTDALVQVDAARGLLGPAAGAEDLAPIDVVAAHLALDVPGQDRLETAETLARRAATVAEEVPLPVVACQAWQLLGALVRHRDPEAATECLERARSIAVQHHLPIWEIHALIRLGNDDALRHGALDRLHQARLQASQVGAVTARFQADASIALHSILRGDYDTAEALTERVLAETTRLKLLETTQYVLLLRAVLAGHRGRRREMEDALAEFRRWNGDDAQHAPRVYGLARTFCALLEEDRSRALDELSSALQAEQLNPTVFHLGGRYGLDLLVRAMSGEADWDTYEELTTEPASRLRWDRQFALFAKAVLLGRAGRDAEATTTVHEAMRVGEPYVTGRHLALRLVCESALDDGWGTPVEWLRAAEEHFHRADVPAVASACRAMLRRAGARVAQRRSGIDKLSPTLRAAGVTVREFEVLKLLVRRLSNREIAEQLHLSPRTVERHVSSLITKTGLPNRIALSEYAADAADD